MRIPFARLRAALPALAMLVLAWCVWSESFSVVTLAEGLALGALALAVTSRALLRSSYADRYRLSPIALLRFALALFIEIFRSGFHAIRIMLTDRINVGVVDLPSELRDPLRGVMVACAITLTPGTVTVDYAPGTFKVVWIDCSNADLDSASESIKGRFERALATRPPPKPAADPGGASQ